MKKEKGIYKIKFNKITNFFAFQVYVYNETELNNNRVSYHLDSKRFSNFYNYLKKINKNFSPSASFRINNKDYAFAIEEVNCNKKMTWKINTNVFKNIDCTNCGNSRSSLLREQKNIKCGTYHTNIYIDSMPMAGTAGGAAGCVVGGLAAGALTDGAGWEFGCSVGGIAGAAIGTATDGITEAAGGLVTGGTTTNVGNCSSCWAGVDWGDVGSYNSKLVFKNIFSENSLKIFRDD